MQRPPRRAAECQAGRQPGVYAAKLLPAQPGMKQLHLPPASFLESEEDEEDAEAEEPQRRSAAPRLPPRRAGQEGPGGVTGARGNGAGRRRQDVTRAAVAAQMADPSPMHDEPRGN